MIDGGAAFPIANPGDCRWVNVGMTMRQAYKMAALMGKVYPHGFGEHQEVAKWCGELADAMLSEDAEKEGK